MRSRIPGSDAVVEASFHPRPHLGQVSSIPGDTPFTVYFHDPAQLAVGSCEVGVLDGANGIPGAPSRPGFRRTPSGGGCVPERERDEGWRLEGSDSPTLPKQPAKDKLLLSLKVKGWSRPQSLHRPCKFVWQPALPGTSSLPLDVLPLPSATAGMDPPERLSRQRPETRHLQLKPADRSFRSQPSPRLRLPE